MFTVTIGDHEVFVGMLARNEVELCPCQNCQHSHYKIQGPEDYTVLDPEYGAEENWCVQCTTCGTSYQGAA